MQVTNEKQKPPWKIPSRSLILFCPPIQLSKDILLLFPFLEPKPNNSSNSSSSTVSSRILSSSFSFSPYPTGLHHSPSPRKRFGSLVGLLTCDLLSYRRVPFSSPSSYSVYSFLSFFFSSPNWSLIDSQSCRLARTSFLFCIIFSDLREPKSLYFILFSLASFIPPLFLSAACSCLFRYEFCSLASIINRLRHHLFRLFCLSGGCQSIASVAVPPFPGAACEWLTCLLPYLLGRTGNVLYSLLLYFLSP